MDIIVKLKHVRIYFDIIVNEGWLYIITLTKKERNKETNKKTNEQTNIDEYCV